MLVDGCSKNPIKEKLKIFYFHLVILSLFERFQDRIPGLAQDLEGLLSPGHLRLVRVKEDGQLPVGPVHLLLPAAPAQSQLAPGVPGGPQPPHDVLLLC